MATPAYVSQGTAGFVTGNCGAADVSATYPASITKGNVLIFTGVAKASTSVDTIDSSSATFPWNLGATSGTGTSVAGFWFWRYAEGTESGVELINYSYTGTTPRGGGQIYQISAGLMHNTGGTNSGTGTSASLPAVTTTSTNELAVGLVCHSITSTVASSTGETGGDWTEAVAESTPGQATMDLQTASMASAGTITGGTITLGTSGTWKTFSFGIQELHGIPIIRPPMLSHHIFR